MNPGIPPKFEPLHRLLAMMLLTVLSLPVMSQQVVPCASVLYVEEEEEIRRYAVELIIFEYVDRATAGTEIFDPDEPPLLPEEEYIFGNEPLGSALDRTETSIDVFATDPVFTDSPPPDAQTDDQADLDVDVFADDTDVLLPPAEDVELVEIQ